MVMALGKAEKMVFRAPIFSALPSAVTMALGNGVLCRVQHSAKWPKTAIFNFFYIPSWQINSYKHITHIYLIHHIYISFITYISHPSTHPSAHIISITIYITYIIISAQVHLNKSIRPSKSTSASQVYHKSITKWTTNEKNTTCTHLGQGDCGEGPAPSFGGAWGGLFEPTSNGDCTKEKRLHVRQDYLDS